MSERCPRCGGRLWNDGGPYCLMCGELPNPAAPVAVLVAEREQEGAPLPGKARRRRGANHQAEGLNRVAWDALVAEFGDLPLDAWDLAVGGPALSSSAGNTAHSSSDLRARFERAREELARLPGDVV